MDEGLSAHTISQVLGLAPSVTVQLMAWRHLTPRAYEDYIGTHALKSFSAPQNLGALDQKLEHSGPKKRKREEKKKMSNAHMLTPKQINHVLEMRSAGITIKAIHKKTGIAMSTVGRLENWKKNKPERFNAYFENASNLSKGIVTHRNGKSTTAIVHVPKSQRYAPKALQDEQTIEIKRLRAEGLSLKDIATKTGLPKSTVNWRLYSNKKKHKANKGAPNGNTIHTSNNGDAGSAPAKNILLGYAFCKVEQYIRFLAERTGLSEEFLKQRLPELLGHSEVRRGTSGFVD
ncbi:MAG TPA: hypothetical protein VF748_16015 [Candidatus Acidoferrum sp.]